VKVAPTDVVAASGATVESQNPNVGATLAVALNPNVVAMNTNAVATNAPGAVAAPGATVAPRATVKVAPTTVGRIVKNVWKYQN
jgi:hypothetical protein